VTDMPLSAQSSPLSSSVIQHTDQNRLTIEATPPVAAYSGELTPISVGVTTIAYGRTALSATRSAT